MRLAAGLVASLALAGCTEPPRPRNAVLIVLDTLRADRLSAYGAERPTSPRIDAFAEQGVLFEHAVTNAPWTLPAMVGMLSGSYPSTAVYRNGLRRSLVENLREAGWSTAAFTEGGFVSRSFGLELGFEDFHEYEYDAEEEEQGATTPGEIEDTFARAQAWLAGNSARPFFLLVHTFETHAPYRRLDFARDLDRGRLAETFEVKFEMGVKGERLALTPDELAYVRALYDGGVAVADRFVGGLLDTLDALGLADETLVVVTSDHGEDLGHRNPWDAGSHGHSLYDELLLVPLVLHDPARPYPVSRVSQQVRVVDVVPTILEILGVPAPPDLHGRSLVPLMTGEETADRVAWVRRPVRPGWDGPLLRGLRTGHHKLIVSGANAGDGPQVELYELEVDPAERNNLAQSDPALRNELVGQLRELTGEIEAQGVPAFRSTLQTRKKLLRRLRALGYVEH